MQASNLYTNFSFKPNEERIYSVEFVAYHDEVSGLLFSVGDPDTIESGSGSGSTFGQFNTSYKNILHLVDMHYHV